MKKLLHLLLVLPFIFTSCSDDDDDFDYAANPIVGTWEFTKVEAKEVNVGTPELLTAITNDIKKDDENASYTMTYTKDGKVTQVMGKEASVEGTYTVKDNVLTSTMTGGSIYISQIEFSGKTMTQLTDLTNYYKNKEVLEKLIGAEDAESATVNKVTTLETFTKK